MKRFWLFSCIIFIIGFCVSIAEGDIHEEFIVIAYCAMILCELEDIREEVEELNEATKKTEEK